MKSNIETLEHLFSENAIFLNISRIFDIPAVPKPSHFNFDRVEGMLLGAAIGDSLGCTTEGMNPGARKDRFGEIRDYLPHPYTGVAKGFPTDDTQLTFWTLEQLVEDDGLVPENLAAWFCKQRIFGIGATVTGFLRNYQNGTPWYQSGPHSAGNGAIMRISPMLIPHLKTGGTGIWADAALSAMMTHNDPASISACIAFTAMLWDLLDMARPPDKEWWVERYVDITRDLEGETRYSARGGTFRDFHGPVWQFVRDRIPWALKENLSIVEACNSWYSGAYLLETLPSVFYILTLYADDLEEAIVRAVNDTRDNDTIASVVGAAVGALHGKKNMPTHWIKNLSGRTSANDDGKVFRVMEKAREAFWESGT